MMPLLPTVLADAIRTFTDESYEGFLGFPRNDLETAQAWSQAMTAYVGAGLNIIPPSVSSVAAEAALLAGLAGLSAGAIPVWDAAFLAYATTLGAGMAPAFVGVPPVLPMTLVPPTLAGIFAAGVAGAPASVQALTIATWIDAWMRTGTSTASGGGPVVPWA